MSIVKRIRQALIHILVGKSPKEVFRVKSGRKVIRGIEEEYIIQLPNVKIDDSTEIALPTRISKSLTDGNSQDER